MVCAPLRRDNPRALALARGLSTVQAHRPCSISLVPQEPVYTLHITEYFVLKIGYLGIVVQAYLPGGRVNKHLLTRQSDG